MPPVTGQSMTLSAGGDILAYARSVTINFEQETVDVTNADSDWWKEFLSGLRGWTIDVEALYLGSDVARKVLQAHYTERSPATVTVIVTLPGAITFNGTAILTSMSYSGPYSDVLSVSASLQGTSSLTPSVS